LPAPHTFKKFLRRLGRAMPVADSGTSFTSVFENIGSITKLFTGSLRSKRAQRRAAAQRERDRERGGPQ
jgi:hypothetical protein